MVSSKLLLRGRSPSRACTLHSCKHVARQLGHCRIHKLRLRSPHPRNKRRNNSDRDRDLRKKPEHIVRWCLSGTADRFCIRRARAVAGRPSRAPSNTLASRTADDAPVENDASATRYLEQVFGCHLHPAAAVRRCALRSAVLLRGCPKERTPREKVRARRYGRPSLHKMADASTSNFMFAGGMTNLDSS